jgi:lipopolysaccharide transport system permease protein
VILLLLLTAAVGVGTLLAALTVAYRDFRHVVPFAVQLWMFATPSVYVQAGGPPGGMAGLLLPLNPAYGLIRAFRQSLVGESLDWYSLSVSAAAGAALLVGGCLYFRRLERSFADVI